MLINWQKNISLIPYLKHSVEIYKILLMNLIIFILILLTNFHLHSQKREDFLMGSIVKSDIWEIDRKKNIEIFKGNVFFENSSYLFKSNTAIYNHNTKEWSVYGSIYSKRKIEEKKYIELECDKAKFNEEKDNAEIYSDNKISIRYIEIPTTLYTSSSKKAFIDVKNKEIRFYENFELKISSISAYSNKAVYKDMKSLFEISQNPYIKTFNEIYNLYIRAEDIFIDKDKKTITAEKNVYGAVYRK